MTFQWSFLFVDLCSMFSSCTTSPTEIPRAKRLHFKTVFVRIIRHLQNFNYQLSLCFMMTNWWGLFNSFVLLHHKLPFIYLFALTSTEELSTSTVQCIDHIRFVWSWSVDDLQFVRSRSNNWRGYEVFYKVQRFDLKYSLYSCFIQSVNA